jgi:segregation and condensation protein B
MSPAPRGAEPLPSEERKRILEAILFAHDGPVTLEMLVECLPAEEPQDLEEDIAALGRDYDAQGAAFEMVRIAGGFQICTRERWANWVARFQRGSRRVRLSRAAVETLAIIAYRQPITRSEMEDIRGVDSGAVLHTLLERNLITIKGRSRGVGRPLLYATTSDFLEYFGLDRLEDLPRLDEIESILKEREEPIEMDRLPEGMELDGAALAVLTAGEPAHAAAGGDGMTSDLGLGDDDPLTIDGILGRSGLEPGDDDDPEDEPDLNRP